MNLVSSLVKSHQPSEYRDLFKDSNITFDITSLDGNIIFSTNNNRLSNLNVDENFINDNFKIDDNPILENSIALYTKIIHDANEQSILIHVSKNLSTINRILKIIFVINILFFTFLNLMLHFLYKNFLKRDIYNKIAVIEDFLREPNINKSLYFEKDPSIKNLWKVIVQWQNRNLKNIKKLNFEKTILDQILKSVDASIVLFDENLKLIIKNNEMDYLFEKDMKNYLDLIIDIEIINILRATAATKEEQLLDLYIPRVKRHFTILVRYLKSDSRYLLTIKDITKTKGLIEVQKTFISDISHELKTPLTNIKGYVIALEDAPEPIRKQFISTIKKNVDKFESIILDFLNISKIESSNVLNLEKIEIKTLEDELNSILSERINQNNAKVTYTYHLLENKDYIIIDFDKVLTILKNLIENAIIYKSINDPKIEVSIMENKVGYKIGVKDNGIGLSTENINKIFERFYRVDKARTSNVAGTGLGLSIVKELVNKCGGKIDVISKEGKGSIFIFTLLK